MRQNIRTHRIKNKQTKQKSNPPNLYTGETASAIKAPQPALTGSIPRPTRGPTPFSAPDFYTHACAHVCTHTISKLIPVFKQALTMWNSLYRLGGPQTEKELPFLSAGNNEWTCYRAGHTVS